MQKSQKKNSQPAGATMGAQSAAEYLKMHLRELQDKNPSYSLRAFAKKINISPGGLSQILNQQKKISLDRALNISRLLNLSERETSYFSRLVQADSIANQNSRIKWLDELNLDFSEFSTTRNLEIDQFRLISDWYGLAILQWITHFPKRTSVSEIAEAFKIKVSDVSRSLERLCHLEIIEKSGADQFKILTDRIEVTSQIPSEVIQSYYRSLLPIIEHNISAQDSRERVIGAEVMAFDDSQIDEVRKLSDEFLISLQKLSMKSKNKKSVYQAFFNFFKLSTNKDREKS